jgi:hypothetical protein
MNHTLATKSGMLVPVQPTSGGAWESVHTQELYYVNQDDKKRRVFTGENCTQDATNWINGRG